MDEINEYFTIFSKEYNLFRRYKTEESLISDLDIVLTKLYLIAMTIIPIGIIIYKIDHYNEDVKYCSTHKNVHSCRNVSFPECILEIIINIFAIKLFMESILTKITNTVNFCCKNGNRVMDYVENELDNLEESPKKNPTNNTNDKVIVEDL